MRISGKTAEDIARDKRQDKIGQAREYLRNNNPSDAVSVAALRERVKRIEILLGIYEWMEE